MRCATFLLRRYVQVVSVCVALAFAAGACSSDRHVGKPGLTEDRFVAFLAEMALAVQRFGTDPEKLADARRSVFEKYKISKQDIEGMVAQIGGRSERWEQILAKVEEKVRALDRSSTRLQEQEPERLKSEGTETKR